MELTYHLEGIIHSKEEMEDFEGPLNLILMLLSKNKIEIRDIQISVILDQYLAQLEEMKALDLEVASEFVQMASHLLYIKTKMLLTSQEDVSELELLMASLEQLRAKDIYSSLKEVTPLLAEASEYGSLYFEKCPEPLQGVKEYRYSHETWELLRALSLVALRGRTAADEEEEPGPQKRIVPKKITYNVKEKSREILEKLSLRGTAKLSELYSASHSRSEVVATFISILELCSLGSVALEKTDDDIVLTFSGGSTEEILQSIGE